MWDRPNNAGDTAGLYTAPASFSFHEEAVGQLASDVGAYERRAALIAWRYAAAALVLGVAVLRRVVDNKPPLTVTGVEELCQEPTLGQLHEALSAPVADLVPARPIHSAIPGEREATARRWATVRDAVDDVMNLVQELAADEDADHPRTKDEAATCLLTRHSPPPTDPTYDGILEPLFHLAEEVPYDIHRTIKQA
ncbi:hypothetical protein [Streptomyces sp. NBC_01789]|uniref:hypothetical protein n=1 Tax=Streptomyces sp. NBC_01789 TaxID=2975941 RepID=UPI002251D758|nr:hypothetical protein [Streptomyces sp. NBC_01789]MCX4451605.1 hypothetical protein [Streptomyces sp. NBC_01789]